ncbi:MAG: helix-turn-helix domain-containing protein [Lachnospirales bacterium]
MIRALIIDKDVESIKYIKNSIKKSPYSVTFIYAVLDKNEDIISTIAKNEINLIYLDVRFYGIQTFSLIKKVAESFPRLRFIYFGNVQDSAYIKQFSSISGIYTYAKPNREYNILKGVELFYKYLKKEQKQEIVVETIYEEIQNKKDLYEEKFLNNLVDGLLVNKGEILTSMKYFGIALDEGYRVFVIKIDYFQKIILTIDDDEKHILTAKLKHKIDEIFYEVKHKSFFSQLNQVIVISNDFQELNRSVAMAEVIMKTVEKELNLKTTIGIGRYYMDVGEVSVSYNEAVSATNYRFYLGYNSIIPIEYAEPNNFLTNRIPLSNSSKLIQTIVMGESEHAINQVEKIFMDMYSIERIPKNFVKKFVKGIVACVDFNVSAKNVPFGDFVDNYFENNNIEKVVDVDSGKKYLTDFINDFSEVVRDNRDELAQSVYVKVKDFFDNFYFENFNLSKVAIGLNVSVDYLNSIFKQYSGESAYDYVQKKRLFRAKKILREETVDDIYIAAQTGFESVMHFRSIFMMYEKRTTDEYRRLYNVNSIYAKNILS